MTKLVGFALILIALVGCAKEDSAPAPTYTSVDGMWTYTTPDNNIKVEFELKTLSSGVVQFLDTEIFVDDVPGAAAGILTDVSLPTIGAISINANNATHVYPYVITFMDCTVNANFSTISAGEATYTYPWGQSKDLTSVVITRK